MKQDSYAKELEKAIFNWYYSGENAPIEPVFNAIAASLAHDMQMLVPIEASDICGKIAENPEKVEAGDTFICHEDLSVKFRHLAGEKEGQYYIIDYADYIIHTVGPIYSGAVNDADLLAACYWNSLDLALEHGCTSIAFPCISMGVYGYPIEEAAKISMYATVRWLDAHPDAVMNIYFCCYRDIELEAYTALTQGKI